MVDAEDVRLLEMQRQIMQISEDNRMRIERERMLAPSTVLEAVAESVPATPVFTPPQITQVTTIAGKVRVRKVSQLNESADSRKQLTDSDSDSSSSDSDDKHVTNVVV